MGSGKRSPTSPATPPHTPPPHKPMPPNDPQWGKKNNEGPPDLDENIVDVQFAIQYTLKSPEDYLFNNRNPDDNVLQAAETSIREVVGKSKMDSVLNQGRSEVASRVKVLMQQILDRYKTGINVTTV